MSQCDCPPYDCAVRVHLHLANDRVAGNELATKFAPLVGRIVQRVLGPQRREEWEDACQAIFLRVFSNLRGWDARCPFCKWLAVVAARRAIDYTRLPGPMERLPGEEIADARPEPVDRELIERLEAAVARFPPEWRAVWELACQEVHRDEIARRLGKSVRTVQYWLAEMREALLDCLAD